MWSIGNNLNQICDGKLDHLFSLVNELAPAVHGLCGYADGPQPDSFTNEEWWGIMRVKDNEAGPDLMEPRAVYYRLQSLWMPQSFSVKINGDAPYTRSTAVTLTVSCTDLNKCVQMQVSNDKVAWSTSKKFTPTRTWSLPTGDGIKTVYVRCRDNAGNWSNPFSDTILLDTNAPVTTGSPAGGTYTTPQTVTLTCSDGVGSVYYTIDGTVPTTGSTVYAGPLLVASTTTLNYFSKCSSVMTT